SETKRSTRSRDPDRVGQSKARTARKLGEIARTRRAPPADWRRPPGSSRGGRQRDRISSRSTPQSSPPRGEGSRVVRDPGEEALAPPRAADARGPHEQALAGDGERPRGLDVATCGGERLGMGEAHERLALLEGAPGELEEPDGLLRGGEGLVGAELPQEGP